MMSKKNRLTKLPFSPKEVPPKNQCDELQLFFNNTKQIEVLDNCFFFPNQIQVARQHLFLLLLFYVIQLTITNLKWLTRNKSNCGELYLLYLLADSISDIIYHWQIIPNSPCPVYIWKRQSCENFKEIFSKSSNAAAASI